jgi:hypothetical protein
VDQPQVKALMVSLAEYGTVQEDGILFDSLEALQKAVLYAFV